MVPSTLIIHSLQSHIHLAAADIDDTATARPRKTEHQDFVEWLWVRDQSQATKCCLAVADIDDTRF